MHLIDDRGRLFGKVNLIDGIVGFFVLLLIPLSYGAFLLFRVPAPKVTRIDPARVIEHEPATLEISGQDLRPFLRAWFGPTESKGFLVQSPTHAEVKVPDLPAGSYDLVLNDEGQELLRVPGALTVVPPPPPAGTAIQVLGEFVDLGSDAAASIGVGFRFGSGQGPPIAEVLAVQAPQIAMQRLKVGPTSTMTVPISGKMQLPAIVRLTCLVTGEECKIGGAVVAQNAQLALPVPANTVPAGKGASLPGELKFRVEEVRTAETRPIFPQLRDATVLVRFVTRPQVLNLMKVGDVDVGTGADAAVLTAVGSERQALTGLTGIGLDANLGRTYQVEQTVTAFDATLRVPVVFTSSGWRYKNRPLRVGAPFSFEAVSYFIDGWILDVKLRGRTQGHPPGEPAIRAEKRD